MLGHRAGRLSARRFDRCPERLKGAHLPSGSERGSFFGAVPVDVITEIEIGRPRETVAAFAVDPGNATKWYRNIRSVEWESQPPLAVGSRLRFTAGFLGRTLEYTYEVREFEPGTRFVMSTSQGPFPMETTYSWADIGDAATLMTLRNRGEPSGFAAMSAPLLARAMRKANEADLRRLKELIEGS